MALVGSIGMRGTAFGGLRAGVAPAVSASVGRGLASGGGSGGGGVPPPGTYGRGLASGSHIAPSGTTGVGFGWGAAPATGYGRALASGSPFAPAGLLPLAALVAPPPTRAPWMGARPPGALWSLSGLMR